jgi:hypothetical protein
MSILKISKHLIFQYAASGTHIGGLRIIEIIARNNELVARLYATNTNSLPSLPSTRTPLAQVLTQWASYWEVQYTGTF